MTDSKYDDQILEIINHPDFYREAFEDRIGFFIDGRERIGWIAEVLRRQYDELDIASICDKNSTEKIVDFLNRLIISLSDESRKKREDDCPISIDEAQEMAELAAAAERIPEKHMEDSAPLLTAASYLDMCRKIFDAVCVWKYPQDISTAYLYCDARMFGYEHEYNEGILGIDRGSSAKFAERFSCMYHNEEIWFGGPKLYLWDRSGRRKGGYYSLPKRFSKWIGSLYCDTWKAYRGIKMYITLRKNGFPVYFSNYREVYEDVLKERNEG